MLVAAHQVLPLRQLLKTRVLEQAAELPGGEALEHVLKKKTRIPIEVGPARVAPNDIELIAIDGDED
jgi:hypothetical protein